MTASDLRRVEQAKTEEFRWRLLKLAHIAGLRGLTDGLVLRALGDFLPGLDFEQIHQALAYLEDKGLVEVQRRSAQWSYTITALGTDCCEGNTECPVGIAFSEF
jgi:predicted MarR family transcription regulator